MIAKIINKIKVLSDSIRFQETIFTLPFAFIGSVIASKGIPELSQVLWITLALTGGRTLGMASNRIIDIEQDKLNPKKRNQTKKDLKSLILSTSAIFKEKPFFMNSEFSLVDCCIAPILWRLPQVGIEIPKDLKHKPINEYMKRVFTRQSFIGSLTEIEKEIRSL